MGNARRSRFGSIPALTFLKVIPPAVAVAFFDRDRDVNRLSRTCLQQGNVETLVPAIANLGLGLIDYDFEITTVLILLPHSLSVLLEPGGIVSLGENSFQKDGMGNPNGLQVLHGTAQDAAANVLVALEGDLTDFDLGALLDHERNAYRCGGNGPSFGADSGKLPAMLRKQLPQNDLGTLYFGGIVLALGRQPHLGFFEPVQHVALGDRTQPSILDLPNGRPLLDVNMDDPAFGSLLALKANVLKVSGIPERVEIALEGRLVIDIAGVSKDSGANGIGGNTAIAVNLNADDEVLFAQSPCEASIKMLSPRASTRPPTFLQRDVNEGDGADWEAGARPRGDALALGCSRAIVMSAENRYLPRPAGVWKTAIIR